MAEAGGWEYKTRGWGTKRPNRRAHNVVPAYEVDDDDVGDVAMMSATTRCHNLMCRVY